MQKPLIASLLSAFIFPGLGLWYLGHFSWMLIFAVPAIFSIGYLLNGSWQIIESSMLNFSDSLIEEFFKGPDWQLDFTRLLDDISYQVDQVPEFRQALWILFAAWALGIAASFWLGLHQSAPEDSTIQ